MQMTVKIAPISESLATFLDQNDYSHIAILVDEFTNKYCLPIIEDLLPSNFTKILIKSGEHHKNLATCERVWDRMTNANMDRHSLLVNLGGGVIGDLGGFCASTYKRGIDFIQIPTTLLAQVDASVGGKLGIDFHGLKNHIGVFQLPKAVLIDPKFIDTLSIQQKKSGFAEIIKHCLIRDEQEWNVIRQQSFEELDLSKLIAHSVAIKEAVVDGSHGSLRLVSSGVERLLNIQEHDLIQLRDRLSGPVIALHQRFTGALCTTRLTTLRDNRFESESLCQRGLNVKYQPVFATLGDDM